MCRVKMSYSKCDNWSKFLSNNYDLVKMIKDFMGTNPSEDEIEMFWVQKILPIDKLSINEILGLTKPNK